MEPFDPDAESAADPSSRPRPSVASIVVVAVVVLLVVVFVAMHIAGGVPTHGR
jgi:hypothetical protein